MGSNERGESRKERCTVAELQLGERVAALESQVKDISSQDSKIDKLMELVYEVKTSIINLKHEGMSKSECEVKHIDYEKRFKEIQSGQREVFWSAITATIALILWLFQQLLNLSIKVG